MKRLAIAALIVAGATPAFAQQAAPSPDVSALQQMFAVAQAGEFAALREAAQLKAENAAQSAEITKLKAENDKLKAAAPGATSEPAAK